LNIALIARGFEYEPIASTAFAVIHPWEGIVPKYLYYYLRCPQFSSYVQALQSGIAYPAISDRNFFSGPVPIPPTKEQKRIVTKIDELMALCDKLEAQQQERESLGEITRIAVLDSVTTAQDSIALSSGWTRVRSNIRLWLENEDAVTELRNAVTFLGCRGLLTEIVAIDSLELRETGFALPLGWSWTTLRQLSDYITSGSRSWSKFIAPQGDIFIRSQDIKQDFLVFENTAFVNLPQKVEGQRTLVRPGDLLITITGANVGKCAQVPLLSQKAYVSQHVALVRVKDVRHTPFLHWWITNAFGGQKYLSRFIYGDKPGLNLSQVGSIPIPFPPQDVQSRIVEALVHYRNLCDRLSTSIRDSRTAAKILATTAVSSVTGIRIQEQEKMRVPKTELVSNLRIGINPPDTGQAQLASILSRNNDELPAKTLWNMSGLEIDDFYQQLKLEMAKGWIVQPETAYVQEVGTS
jgi:type I restriction enzyme S subunit